MLLSHRQSFAFKAVAVIAILMVVIRHGQNLHLYYAGGSPWMPLIDANVLVQEAITRMTECAIPVFFTMSGFWFFLGAEHWRDIVRKWKHRLRSLVIPYFLWNFLLLAAVVAAFAMFPPLRRQLISTYGIEWHWRWFAEKFGMHPIVGQFWYIRTLMVFCLLTPLFLLLYRSSALSAAVLALLLCRWDPIDCGILSSEGLACFFFGGFVGCRKWHKRIEYRKAAWVLLPCVIGLVGIELYCGVSRWIWILRIFLSMLLLMQIALFAAGSSRFRAVIRCLSHFSFFLYAAHSLLLGVSMVPLSRIAVHVPAASFAAYVFCILVTVAAAYGIAWMLDRGCPRAYRMLTGGR